MWVICTARYHTYSSFLKFRHSARFKFQTKIEQLIWGRIKLLYMVHNIIWGWYRLRLFIMPKTLEILIYIFCICAFQVICWSMFSPGNKNPLLSLKVPHIILTLIYCWLYLVGGYGISSIFFLTFSDNLFNSSHFIFPSVHCLLLVKGTQFYLGCFVPH